MYYKAGGMKRWEGERGIPLGRVQMLKKNQNTLLEKPVLYLALTSHWPPITHFKKVENVFQLGRLLLVK